MQSGGWGLVNPRSCPQFWRSIKNANSTQFIELHFGVSEQIKPLQPIGQAAEFKFESKFEPLPTSAGHLAITPEGYSRRQSKDLTAKSMAKLLGQRSGTAWAGLTGEHKHRAFQTSRRQSLRAATGLLSWVSSTFKKVLMLCRYRAVMTEFFFIGNEISIKWARSCYRPKQRP